MTSHRPNSARSAIRVLHLTQPVDGGTARVVQHLVKTDREAGRVVRVVSPAGELSSWAEKYSVEWTQLLLSRQPHLPTDLRAVWNVREWLRQIDVVLLHSSKAGAIGRLALSSLPRNQRPKCVFFPHAWSWYVGGRAAKCYRLFERVAERWTDAIVVVSRGEERDGKECLRRSASKKIVRIENGVDLDLYSPEGEAADRTSDPMIVCVGRLCEQKGQDVLIRAIELLDKRDVDLVLLGDGPSLAHLQSVAENADIADRVHFVRTTDPRPYYRSADIVALPSRWEGLSLVLLEAMACGGTVVVTRAASGGLAESDGLVILPGPDSKPLAAALKMLLDDSAMREALSRKARLTIELNYSLGRAEQEYNELMEFIVQDEAGGAHPWPCELRHDDASLNRHRHSASAGRG